MKAVVYEAYGPPEVLRCIDLPEPSPGAGEVLVRIRYAGVNPIDWKIGEGRLRAHFDCAFPLIVGRELAGVVEAVGGEVRGVAPGDAVFAALPWPGGGFAELAVLPASHVAKAPRCLSLKESAALPLTGLTCWQSLVEKAGLREGQSVFILSGAGGTGSLAVQIAKQRGATVATTSGPANLAYVKDLGADEVYDYAGDEVIERIRRRFPDGVDLVFSNVLGALHQQAYGVIKRGGTLVTIGEPPIAELAARLGVNEIDHVVRPDGGQLAEIARLVDGGELRPPAITEFPLARCAEAFRSSMQGHVRGKIVLRVA